MRVLITGATGMIGSKITSLCHEKGIDVNYLTTSKDKISDQSNYKGFYWDPNKKEIDANCIKGVDAIINLVGSSVSQRWTSSNKEEIIKSRTETAELLFETLNKNPNQISQIISASAIGVYPDSLEKLYFEDENSVDDSFLGKVVVKWEEAVDNFKDLGLKVAKIRIGLVLSNEGGALPKMKEPVSLNAGAAFGSGKQWQSWIHVEDLSRIFIYALENKLEGVYNGVAPNPVTNQELIKEIAIQLDKSIWLPNIPAIALKAALGEMATIVLASQLVSSNKIEEEGFNFNYTNLSRALGDLLKK